MQWYSLSYLLIQGITFMLILGLSFLFQILPKGSIRVSRNDNAMQTLITPNGSTIILAPSIAGLPIQQQANFKNNKPIRPKPVEVNIICICT